MMEHLDHIQVKCVYQGHWIKDFGKMDFLDCWMPNCFAMTNLWY